jgi:hypothetical protein
LEPVVVKDCEAIVLPGEVNAADVLLEFERSEIRGVCFVFELCRDVRPTETFTRGETSFTGD